MLYPHLKEQEPKEPGSVMNSQADGVPGQDWQLGQDLPQIEEEENEGDVNKVVVGLDSDGDGDAKFDKNLKKKKKGCTIF